MRTEKFEKFKVQCNLSKGGISQKFFTS